jgi:serine protease AprX
MWMDGDYSMNTHNSLRRILQQRFFASLVVLGLLILPFGGTSKAREFPMLSVIVQAVDVGVASGAVNHMGGTVTHELDIINAVAASVPAHQIDSLELAAGVTSVWLDTGVQSADSADPGITYSPKSGTETVPAGFDARKLAACDGDRDALDTIPRFDLSPYAYQSYSFKPGADPYNLPKTINLRFVFKEKSLNQAQLQVYQSSTRIWHLFGIDTLRSNDANIDTTLDLSGVLTSPEDFANIEVRFLASRNDGGEKAEVDCATLSLDGRLHTLAAGGEYKPAGFDLRKVLSVDKDNDSLDYFPVRDLNPHVYQSYTFTPTVDPENLPGLMDLNFVFKEKSLNNAQIQVYQTSTRIWHSFDIDTLSTDDRVINTLVDLSEVLIVPEDFNRIEVRFLVSKSAGGEKAEVDMVSLRLADLVGESTTIDVTTGFEAVNALPVWKAGNTGTGIGIAVLDSGVKKYREIETNTAGQKVGLGNGWNAVTRKGDGWKDQNGHGTLVASIISNQRGNSLGRFYGVAPDSVIIPIKVLDRYGKGRYSQVIDGIQWAILNKDKYNIKVMNLSLSAPVQSYYWDDPLNQAVMKAWQAGIVVVVAAGNSGPDPITIGVPGNNPYVITVGALTDAHTPSDLSDDYIPSFSATGPTYEGFVKPDLVAPGGHIVGLMSDKCELARAHPEYKIEKDYFKLTGTSMSAAQVSGVVALILAANPGLTPDEVKYRLLASAVPAVISDGVPAYSIWQQGAGRVNAYEAVYGDFNGKANYGLDINADIAGVQHFGGFTFWNPETNQYYLVDETGQPIGDGYIWGGGVAWSKSYTWGGGVAWSKAYTLGGGVAWSKAYTWGGGVAWSKAYTWGGGVAWSKNIAWSEASASLVSWVGDE